VRLLLVTLLWFLPPAAVLAASTQFSLDRPIVNFRLPMYTPEGHRAWLVRGSEARFRRNDRIDIQDLTLSIFSGGADGKVDTIILSPAATVQPDLGVITGASTIRVISAGANEFEVTGADWRYDHREKKVSIARNVHVTFQAELKDFLK
jgi:hypothetical protein